jgi:hypothetical protein
MYRVKYSTKASAIPPGSCLEGEAVAQDSRITKETGDHLSNQQPVWGTRDLGGAGDDLRRIANRRHLDDKINVISLDLSRNAREWQIPSIDPIIKAAQIQAFISVPPHSGAYNFGCSVMAKS